MTRMALAGLMGVWLALSADKSWAQTGRSRTATSKAAKKVPGKAPVPAVPTPEHRTSLDTWIVQRMRGSQLLPDSTPVVRSVAADAVLPHVESVREGTRTDTLFALHFAERPGVPALANDGSVRVVGPTGTITPIMGRVAARRPFRALRAPQANNDKETDWRYGWAYLVLLPKAGRIAPVTAFRGWMLVDTLAGR